VKRGSDIYFMVSSWLRLTNKTWNFRIPQCVLKQQGLFVQKIRYINQYYFVKGLDILRWGDMNKSVKISRRLPVRQSGFFVSNTRGVRNPQGPEGFLESLNSTTGFYFGREVHSHRG
jgi:hypothetical protein